MINTSSIGENPCNPCLGIGGNSISVLAHQRAITVAGSDSSSLPLRGDLVGHSSFSSAVTAASLVPSGPHGSRNTRSHNIGADPALVLFRHEFHGFNTDGAMKGLPRVRGNSWNPCLFFCRSLVTARPVHLKLARVGWRRVGVRFGNLFGRRNRRGGRLGRLLVVNGGLS